MIPGIKEFVAEYTSDKALGDDGYLADKGLVPAAEGRNATRYGGCDGARGIERPLNPLNFR